MAQKKATKAPKDGKNGVDNWTNNGYGIKVTRKSDYALELEKKAKKTKKK